MASLSGRSILSSYLLGAFSFCVYLQSVADAANILSRIDYSPQQVSVDKETITIKMDRSTGSRVRTEHRYAYGTFRAWVKCPSGDTSGLVSALYLSSSEGSLDQIDLEWLGNDKHSIQTNYYVNHQGGHEQDILLGFDCSQAFHKYTISWSRSSIKWYIDGKLVRTVTNDGEAPYPTKPSYLYSSIWDASFVNAGAWAGRATYNNAPYYLQLKNASASGNR